MQVEDKTFFEIVNRFDIIPFEQTEAWLHFKQSQDVSFAFFVDNLPDASVACWGRIIQKPFIGKILDIIGISKSGQCTSKHIANLFQSIIKDSESNFILYNDVLPYDVLTDISMRRIGFNRPLGNSVCPLTIFVDVQSERKPDRNWKRNIKKAQDSGVVFRIVESPKINDALCVSNMFKELAEMKSLGYQLEPDKLMCLLTDSHYRLCYVEKDGEPLCARIIYTHNNHSADVFAANSYESRRYSATHLICEEIFAKLKEEGVKTFDFSRIPPSNNETDSVYVFKAASGGLPIQYGGEWYYSNKKLIPLFFCIYNFFIRKAHHY